MNFIDQLNYDLTQNGLSDSQANEIVTTFISDEKHTMRTRWWEDTTNYPVGLYNVLWGACKNEALRYIDAHCPKAWFRAVFDPKDPIHAEFAKQNS